MPVPRHASRCQTRHLLGKVSSAIFSAVIFLVAACGREETSFFPLSDGRSWHYDVSKTTMDGSFQQKYIVQSLAAQNWQGSDSIPIVSAAGEQYLYQESKSGVYRVAFRGQEDAHFVAHTEPQIVLPDVLQPGNAWQQLSYTKLLENTGPPWETLFRIVQPVQMQFQIDTLDASVSVPAGSFDNCLKISGFGETNVDVGNYIGRTVITVHVERWYAKGVGLVKSFRKETTTADAINLGTLTLELEYSVN